MSYQPAIPKGICIVLPSVVVNPEMVANEWCITLFMPLVGSTHTTSGCSVSYFNKQNTEVTLCLFWNKTLRMPYSFCFCAPGCAEAPCKKSSNHDVETMWKGHVEKGDPAVPSSQPSPASSNTNQCIGLCKLRQLVCFSLNHHLTAVMWEIPRKSSRKITRLSLINPQNHVK